MIGKVIINNLNNYQGVIATVENCMIFIGLGAGVNEGALLALTEASDLDSLLGGPSGLKTQIEAARAQSGQDWFAYACPLAESADWRDAVDYVMERANGEGIVLTDPVNSSGDLEAMQTKAESIMARYMRPVMFYCRTRERAALETWAEFREAITPLVSGVAADQVSVCASIWGGGPASPELGAYVGRLCNSSVTVADTPMRVATGPLLAVPGWDGTWSERPMDADGRILDLAVIEDLERSRFSVPQWYPDYEGVYWADGNVLDVSGGDYQVIENVRVVQKAMRKVYPLLVARIGDRRLNETPKSIAENMLYFMRPLREMSKSRGILGFTFPGEINPPEDGDIKLYWVSKYELEVYIAVRPYNCPKKITCNLILDLTNYAA